MQVLCKILLLLWVASLEFTVFKTLTVPETTVKESFTVIRKPSGQWQRWHSTTLTSSKKKIPRWMESSSSTVRSEKESTLNRTPLTPLILCVCFSPNLRCILLCMQFYYGILQSTVIIKAQAHWNLCFGYVKESAIISTLALTNQGP